MNKKYIVSLLVVLSLVLTGVANAASTIGTNMSTTGTFTVTPASDSATSIRFQNAAGTSFFIADSTNLRIGVGAAPSTTFEVQGTASASYFFTGNTIQVGGTTSSAAYSRFGTDATGYTTDLDAANDLLISGALEVNGNAFFDGKASISDNFQTAGRFILGDNGDTGVIDTSDWDISATGVMTGISGITNDGVYTQTGTSVNTLTGKLFGVNSEFQGTASASYFLTGNTIQVGGFASVAYSRFGISATTHSNFITTTNDLLINGDFEVDASAQFDSFVQMDTTATTSFSARSSSVTQGACIELKDDDGSGYTYLRVSNGTGKFSAVNCK